MMNPKCCASGATKLSAAAISSAPILTVSFDDVVAKIIDFFGATELIEATDCGSEISADSRRLVMQIDRQLTKSGVGVVVIAVLHLFLQDCSVGRFG